VLSVFEFYFTMISACRGQGFPSSQVLCSVCSFGEVPGVSVLGTTESSAACSGGSVH